MAIRKFLVLAAAATLCGCGSINEQAADAIGEAWGLIDPEWRAYVSHDLGLSEEQRQTRVRHAKAMGEAIEELRRGDD